MRRQEDQEQWRGCQLKTDQGSNVVVGEVTGGEMVADARRGVELSVSLKQQPSHEVVNLVRWIRNVVDVCRTRVQWEQVIVESVKKVG